MKTRRLSYLLLGLALVAQFLCMNLAQARLIYEICDPVSALPEEFGNTQWRKMHDATPIARALLTGLYWGVDVPADIVKNQVDSNIGQIKPIPGGDKDFARVNSTTGDLSYPLYGTDPAGNEILIRKGAVLDKNAKIYQFEVGVDFIVKPEFRESPEFRGWGAVGIGLRCKTTDKRPE